MAPASNLTNAVAKISKAQNIMPPVTEKEQPYDKLAKYTAFGCHLETLPGLYFICLVNTWLLGRAAHIGITSAALSSYKLEVANCLETAGCYVSVGLFQTITCSSCCQICCNWQKQ